LLWCAVRATAATASNTSTTVTATATTATATSTTTTTFTRRSTTRWAACGFFAHGFWRPVHRRSSATTHSWRAGIGNFKHALIKLRHNFERLRLAQQHAIAWVHTLLELDL
jgi:hypothetical protein